MAGDWIPVRKDLATTREVLFIAQHTGHDIGTVIYALIRLWWWFDSEATDGFVSGLCPAFVHNFLGQDELFWRTVIGAGWLIEKADGLAIPNPDNWISKTAKARLLDSKRKRDGRRKMSAQNPESVPPATGQEPDKKRTKGKERKGKEKDMSPPKEKTGVPRFLELYHDLFLERFGTKPKINEGKDPGIVKRLLDGFGQVKLEGYLRRYMASADQFIVDAGFTLGVFEVKLNTFVVAGSGNGKGKAGASVSDLTPEQRERAEAVYGGKNPTGN